MKRVGRLCSNCVLRRTWRCYFSRRIIVLPLDTWLKPAVSD
jgi:hypothetical protein